tara:strand:- start:1196 stop:1657 length:462 start_codon:yes stop_codon:yes gene_type:complete
MKLLINRYKAVKGGTLSNVDLICPDRGTINTFHGIECPWKENKAGVSCIPSGKYELVPHSSDRYPDVWAFVGGTVAHYPDSMQEGQTRYACLIHAANYAHQIQGCLALGTGKGETKHDGESIPAVWSSRDAISALREELGNSVSHTAEIKWFA